MHTIEDGRRFLVMHGDGFDSVVQCGKLVVVLEANIYDIRVRVNRYVN